MHKAIEPEFQKSVRRWLRLATALCVLAPLLTPVFGQEGFSFIMLLPVANCMVFWAILFVQSWPWRPTGLDEYSSYIKERYPHIWKKLHPWGDYSYNSFTAFSFIAGRYDDGTDDELNFIKYGLKHLNVLLIWPFVLIPTTWLVALPVYFYFYPPER